MTALPAGPTAEADEPQLSKAAKLKVLLHGWADLRNTPYGLKPVLVLGLVYSLQNFDGNAFNIAGPQFVRRGIPVTQVISVGALVGFVTIFLNLAVGYYGERHRRLPILVVGTILSGIAACFTGYCYSGATLATARGVDDGIGNAADVPTFALVSDYYPPEVRGRVFSLNGALRRTAEVVALPLTGFGLLYFSLQSFFVATGICLAASAVLAAVTLREPVRGYMERRSAGLSEAQSATEDEPLSFGESFRTVFAVRTVRRLFVADIAGGLGDASSVFLIFLLADRYGLSPLGLALFALPRVVTSIFAGLVGGSQVDRLLSRNPGRALTLYGVFSAIAAAGTLLVAFEPPLYVLVLVFVLLGLGLAFIGPATSALYSQVIPPRVRTLGLQFPNLAGAFTFLVYFPFLSIVLRQDGYGPVFLIGGGSFFLSGLVKASAGAFFDIDRRNALAATTAAQRWNSAVESGTGRLLVCSEVDVEYDGVQVLFGVDLEVDAGEIVALLGTNGAGKSTLLRAISGISEASGGAVVVAGRDITHMPPHEIARRGVVFMPGGRGIFPDLTVRENLLLGGWSAEPEEQAAGLAEVLELFPSLGRRYDVAAGLLSGGEQQQVALAQAFLMKPQLLMIDELSLGLSPAVVGELIQAVKQINARGVAVLVVEQSVTVALELAGRAVFMEKGQIRFDGPTADLLRRPDILRAVYVTGSSTAGGERPSRALPGRTAPAATRVTATERGRPILEVAGITKTFGGVTALDDVTLPVYEGQVLGLIGPNGSGKTTLFDVISGFLPPDSGTVSLAGEDITSLSPDERARKRLVRRFQDARLFPSLSVTETLLVSLERDYNARNPLLAGVGAPRARRAESRARTRTDHLLSLLELVPYRDTLVGELSTGLRRIVDLACVMASDPEVLLLDEPSTGVAQSEAEGLAPLLRRVQRETGCTILIIEHDMGLLRAVADEFVALHLGSVIARGAPSDVLADERVVAAYLGTSDAAVNRSGGTR